jgi:hypothetical protein
MAKTSGTQVVVGLGIESAAAPGTAVAEAVFVPWMDYSVQTVVEKSHFTAARGIRNRTSDSMIRRKYSQGSLGFIPTVENMPYFLSLALGSVSSSTVTDSAYTHTFTVQNTNATPKSATMTTKSGGVQTAQYTNMVCNTFNFEVSDDYSKATVELIGQFAGTDTVSESFVSKTLMAYHNMTVKFGTSFSAAAGNAATPLKGFKLNINNNIQLDESFLSGSNTITSGNLVMGRLQITGSYSLHFSDTVELAKYQANTKNAAIVTMTGDLIGATSVQTIQFKLGKLILTKPPVQYQLDGLVILNQEFEVEYDATDTEMVAIVINAINNASTHVYDPS